MFQYAAGRALSLRNQSAFALDISGFENYELHQGFELQRVFGLPVRDSLKGGCPRCAGLADFTKYSSYTSRKAVCIVLSQTLCCRTTLSIIGLE